MPVVAPKGKYNRYIDNALIFCDFVIFNIAFLVAYLLIGRYTEMPMREILLVVNVAYVPVLLLFTHPHSHRTIYMEKIVRNSIAAILLHFVTLVLLLFFLKVEHLNLDFFGILYAVASVLIITWWVLARRYIKHMRKNGRNFTKVVIVGTGATAMSLYNEMSSDAGFGFKLVGFFDDTPSTLLPDGTYLGKLEDLSTFVHDNNIDEIYYTLSGERHETLRHVINIAEKNVAHFYYVPQISRYVKRGFVLHSCGTVPVLSIMPQPLEHTFNRGLKRGFDILFSSVVLLFSPIIFIPVAIAVKISSPGPVFFKQLRTGYKGRNFYCWKFRTMKVNASADSTQATRDDPRKTKVGDFLRRTSIDELPQFINVWLGDMSVVGPRPHMLKHTEQYSRLIDQYMVRHYIKPGITGWAQVSGLRGQTDELWKMERRVEHDVWYIKNWSFLLDLKIIVRTLTNAIHGEKNAF